jgi:hypothetical protein
MARRIVRLIEEKEDKSKQLRARYLVVKVARMKEVLKTLSMQERREPTPKVASEEVLHSNPFEDAQQYKVTTLREKKNKNGKRNLETQITRKNVRKLSKNKEKLEKLEEIPEKTSKKGGLQNLNFVRLVEQHKLVLRHGEAI